MNKYIEIITEAIEKSLYGKVPSDNLDALTEDDIVDIITIITSAIEFINDNWVDQREHEILINRILCSIGKNYKENTEMLNKLKAYHKELLSECEDDPKWIKFDCPERFSTTYKTFNPNEYKDTNERNAALEKWLKFRSKEDYEAAKLANWGHEPDEWIGL